MESAVHVCQVTTYRELLLFTPIDADLVDSLSGVLDLDFDLSDLTPLSTRSTTTPLDGWAVGAALTGGGALTGDSASFSTGASVCVCVCVGGGG